MNPIFRFQDKFILGVKHACCSRDIGKVRLWTKIQRLVREKKSLKFADTAALKASGCYKEGKIWKPWLVLISWFFWNSFLSVYQQFERLLLSWKVCWITGAAHRLMKRCVRLPLSSNQSVEKTTEQQVMSLRCWLSKKWGTITKSEHFDVQQNICET